MPELDMAKNIVGAAAFSVIVKSKSPESKQLIKNGVQHAMKMVFIVRNNPVDLCWLVVFWLTALAGSCPRDKLISAAILLRCFCAMQAILT